MCQMKRRSFLTSSAALLGAGAAAHSQSSGDLHHHVHTISVMTESANRLLATLDAQQKVKTVMPFNDEERFRWFYTPVDRKGITWFELSPYQRHLASALLAAGLSQTGYIKAVTIMSLEDVLKIMENDSGVRRNPENYHFTIFGEPSDSSTWGYRVEGHHVSQNYTIMNGQVVDGPSFFGSNPAEVRQGPRKGLRVLASEDDMGFGSHQRAERTAAESRDRRSEGVCRYSHEQQTRGRAEGAAFRTRREQDERHAIRRRARVDGIVRAQYAGRYRAAADRSDRPRRPQLVVCLGGRDEAWRSARSTAGRPRRF